MASHQIRITFRLSALQEHAHLFVISFCPSVCEFFSPLINLNPIKPAEKASKLVVAHKLPHSVVLLTVYTFYQAKGLLV